MSKLIVSEFVSLNGVMEAPGGEHTHPHTGWTFESIYGDDHYAYKGEEIDEAESLLLGRKTYEGFADAWPRARGRVRRQDQLDAEVRRLLDPHRPRVGEHDRALGRPDRVGREAARRERRSDPRQRLGAARPRARRGRPRRRVAGDGPPVLIADGLRMFPDPDDMQKLKLADARSYDSGVALLIYTRAED